jgi:hypothetical protein
MPKPNTPPEYDGPFESQEEEDLAYTRSQRILARREAEKKAQEEAEEEAERKKKKKGGLPYVE